MAEEAKYDAIVVGAGPSGIAAALTMAQAGLTVAVLERGEEPGTKNVYGGILFANVLAELVPGFLEEAPLERHIVTRRFSLLSEEAEMAFEFRCERYNQAPFNYAFTVSRARFDRWFASKAEEAGAELFTGVVVDDFVWSDGKVVGIKARGERPGEYDELYADVVICAEGANSLLARKAGLWKNPQPEHRATAVKEVIALPREVLEDRFHLQGDEGVAIEYFGAATKGMVGSGFLYTNGQTLSIGVGVSIAELHRRRPIPNPNELLEGLKSHPAVRPLIRGGETVEYMSHMIPEAGFRHLPQLVTDGLILVGDAAGLVNTSLFHEGTNLAMASGRAAGEAVIEAKEKGDFSRQALSSYLGRLRSSFVFRDLRRYQNAVRYLMDHPQLLREYPGVFADLLARYFEVSGRPKEEVRSELMAEIRRRIGLLKLLRAAWGLQRHVI
ncbi:MAG: FAD-dependent oxidoreductase [candidate division KSB1 bacterium]|nr:FAD-dependent oxidoreductase [candidate division KSB1 bacterium]